MSGTMERFPTLKIVTHRLGGGMMPFYGNRFLIKLANLKKNLQRPVSESLERIYGDTAVDGTAAALPLPCGHAFFGTDYPFLLPGAGRVVPEGKSAHREGDDPA